jgi:hypothetical protein
MSGICFRGTNVEQDGRWGKSDEKLISKMSKAGKFAAILDTKINLLKVNIPIISKWVYIYLYTIYISNANITIYYRLMIKLQKY